jgi:signal transduction histidine kinase
LPELSAELAADVALVQGLPAVPRILSVCLRASGMGVVAVARVTPEAWVACAVLDRMGFGLLPGGELPVSTTLCREVQATGRPVVIEHASREPLWCDHATPRTYGYESHVSVPIVLPDGAIWGTLVAIDPHPLPVRAPDTVATFSLFAELLGHQIEAERRLGESQALLDGARAEAALREQFIAVLGHDLRNPIAAVGAGLRLLSREGTTEAGGRLVDLMEGSLGRMAGLVDDVLDFARGRLAGGLPTTPRDGVDLRPLFAQILAELESIHPDRVIHLDLAGLPLLRCDPRRMGQMLSNILGNALTHGAADEPIRVGAAVEGGALRLWVANGGAPVPPDTLLRLFEPFARGAGGEGLGLGLFIAAEIARAHGGTLRARSDARETCLTFEMSL